VPQYVSGLVDVVRNPIHATGVGLLLFGFGNEAGGNLTGNDATSEGSIFKRMKEWFQSNF
jgi:cell division protein FtsA